jgi:hypothetical protein
MPDVFTYPPTDPRNDVANAQVVASQQTIGSTANIPPAQISDVQPVGTPKQQVTAGTVAGTPNPAYTTATCPVEKKVVAKIVLGSGAKLPTVCPSCGYQKITYS